MNKLLYILLLVSISSVSYGQYKIGLLPRSSPDRGVYEKIGYTGIEITYGSPKVNNREVFGNLVPWGSIWRAGANNATRIEFSEDVEIEGQVLARGVYGLFVIPRERGDWTIIFNHNYDQWGAFQYNSEEDALRVDIPVKTNSHTEKLEYILDYKGYDKGTISLLWSEYRLDLDVNTNYLEILREEIEIAGDNNEAPINSVVYMQGAEYLLRLDKNLDLAQEWIDQSIDLYDPDIEWNKQYYPREYILGHIFWTKAKISAVQGDYKEAISYGEKMKSLYGDFTYYDEEKEFEKIDEQMNKWIAK